MAQLSSRRWMLTAIFLALILGSIQVAIEHNSIERIYESTSKLSDKAAEMHKTENQQDLEQSASVTYMASGFSAPKWVALAIFIPLGFAGAPILMAMEFFSSGYANEGTALGYLQYSMGIFLAIIAIWIYYEAYVIIFKPKGG